MSDIFGKVFGVMLAFILLIIAPFTMLTLTNEMVARRTILNEMQSFIDETIDSRQVTDTQIEDLYLAVTGLGPVVDVDIERYVRTVDPDPKKPGDIYVTYVYTDNNREYNQGDKVKIRVHAIGYTGTEKYLRTVTGLFLPSLDYSLSARVR